MAFEGLEHFMVYTKCMRGKKALRLRLYVLAGGNGLMTECILNLDNFKNFCFELSKGEEGERMYLPSEPLFIYVEHNGTNAPPIHHEVEPFSPCLLSYR